MSLKIPNCDSGFYRFADNIKNFKIRVTIKKTSNVNKLNAKWDNTSKLDDALEMELVTNQSSEKDGEICLIPWQKKIFSKSEINFYKDNRLCETFLDHKYHDLINNIDAQELSYYIHTFTDVDYKTSFCKNFEDPELITKDINVRESELRNRKKPKLRKTGFKSRPSFPKDLNLVTCKECLRNHSKHQIMFIMADLAPTEFSEEILLAILHVDDNGILNVNPDFNAKTKPYILQNQKLETFEYIIENVSDVMSKVDKNIESEKYSEICTRHMRYLKSCVGTEFDLPNHGILKLFLMCEIVEANNFGNKNLFAFYNIDLPIGWSAVDTSWLSGATQTSKPIIKDKMFVSHFSYPIQGDLEFSTTSLNSEVDLIKWPSIMLEISSKDTWGCIRSEGYGFVELPHEPGSYEIIVSTWKPIIPTPIEKLRHHFIGNVNEIEELSFVKIPNSLQDPELSRLGFQTESSGNFKLKLHVLHQSQSFLMLNEKKDLLSKLEISTQHNSVQAVLVAFQKARHKMLSARNKLWSPGLPQKF